MSSEGKVYWHVLIAMVTICVMYMELMPVINITLAIVLIGGTLLWLVLPVILFQWYMWSDGQ